MSRRVSRRDLLGSLGAGTAVLVAGCTAFESSKDDAQRTSAAAESSIELEDDPFVEVYRETIDGVALLEVHGALRGQGSAFVYDDEHLLTNHHVVADADEIDVQFADNDWTGAEVVGTDPHTDLGVVAVDDRPSYAEPLSLAESSPTVGQSVLALGNPLGLDASATSGIVSGTNRSLEAQTGYQIPAAIQIDAALNPGNSGGPIVDLDGDVVAVSSAGGGDNIGFGIASEVVRRVVPSLIEDGEFQHTRVGIRTLPVDRRVAMANDMDAVRGVMVTAVVEDGPADGVLQGSTDTEIEGRREIPVGGDVILAIDGTPLPTDDHLSRYLALETDPGDEVTVTVLRDGEEQDVELTLGRRSD